MSETKHKDMWKEGGAGSLQIMEKMKNYSMQQRKKLRQESNDTIRFGLGEIQREIQDLPHFAQSDVLGLAGRIKRRRQAEMDDMRRLNHAFLQGMENINAFINTPGAIEVIVKELTGNDGERQIGACEILCNLSLGEAHVCERIAQTAGSYLLTYLSSSDLRLKRTALWTISNVLYTKGKGVSILLSMKVLATLWRMYVGLGYVPQQKDDDFREDTAIALQALVSNSISYVSNEDLAFLRESMTQKDINSVGGEYHLQILFNAFFNTGQTPHWTESEMRYFIQCGLENITTVSCMAKKGGRRRLLFTVRILGDLMAGTTGAQAYVLLIELCSLVFGEIHSMFNELFRFAYAAFHEEVFWFLSNVLVLSVYQSGESGMEYISNNLVVPQTTMTFMP